MTKYASNAIVFTNLSLRVVLMSLPSWPREWRGDCKCAVDHRQRLIVGNRRLHSRPESATPDVQLEVARFGVKLTYNDLTVQMDSRDAHQDGFWEWAGSGNWFAMAAGERYIS
jgi:hypothetical protein